MRFNSQSVMLNRGTNFRIGISIPTGLINVPLSVEMWDEAVAEFNKQLDTRKQVSEIVEGIKVDILRVHCSGGLPYLWLVVKEKDMPMVNQMRFTFKGKLVYENEKSDQPERLMITDLLYEMMGVTKSVFKKELTS